MIRPHDIEDLSDEDEEEDEDDGPRSDYQWCMHCERAYKRGEHRMINGLRMCPYQGCNGDVFSDGWDWDQFREPLPQYPAVPEFGIQYPMYPTDYPVLSKGAEKILVFLVAEIRRGRFDPANERTLCSFQEVHDALGLQRTDNNWEKSLNSQGLDHLAKWTRTHKLPAISALVVKSTKPRLPVGKEDWCREQIQAAIDLDWSPWLPDGEPVTLAEIIQESRSFLEGATTQVTQEIKARCDALRKKTKELLRDADGLLRCKVCDWHKPEDEMISGDIVELHHLDPISEAPDEGRIVTITDAVKLFVPVCPNCHRMIHARTGGRVFNMRGEGGGAAGAGVIFRNINIEDPRPTLQHFFICMTVPEPCSKMLDKRGAGDFSGVHFQNISIAAPSVLGEPQILWGQSDARIRNLTFENLTLAGKPVHCSDFFKTNEFVDGLIFSPSTVYKP